MLFPVGVELAGASFGAMPSAFAVVVAFEAAPPFFDLPFVARRRFLFVISADGLVGVAARGLEELEVSKLAEGLRRSEAAGGSGGGRGAVGGGGPVRGAG